MSNLIQKAKKGIFTIGSLELFRYLVEISLLAFTARMLSPTDFGIVAVALIVIGIGDSFSDLGVKTALIQFKEDSYQYLNTAWTIQIIRAIFLFFILLFLSHFFSSYFEKQELIYVLPFLALRPIIQALTNPMQTYHIRNVEYKKYSIMTFSGVISRIMYVIPLTFYFKNYWAIALSAILVTLTKMIVSYLLDQYKPRFSLKNFYKLFNFGVWILFSRVLLVCFKQLPSLIIGKVAGLEFLGGYKLADQGGNMLTNIYKKYASYITIPFFSEKNRSGKEFKNTIENYLIIAFAFVIPVSIFGALNADSIVFIFLGEKWLFISVILCYMFIIGGLNFLALCVSSLLISIGRPKADTIARSTSLLSLLVGFIFSESAIQVVQSLLVASLVYFIFCYIYLIYYYKFNQLKVLFRSLINIVPFFPSIYIQSFFEGSSISIYSEFILLFTMTLLTYLLISYVIFKTLSFSLFRLLLAK